MANFEAMGVFSPSSPHHHPIITQGDELTFMRPPSWAILGLEPDERREIAPDGHFAASPGLSRPYPTRPAFLPDSNSKTC